MIQPATLAKLRTIKVDPALVAVVGCAANVVISSPRIVGLRLAADGLLYGVPQGGTAATVLIGDWNDIMVALRALADAVGLTEEEWAEVADAIRDATASDDAVVVRLGRLTGRARFTET